MKTPLRMLALSALVAELSTGCTGFTGVAKALSKDQNTLLLRASSPYGPQLAVRAGLGNTNTIMIDTEGRVTINPLPPSAAPAALLVITNVVAAPTPPNP